MKELEQPWENYTPPGGQMRIEGTDQVPLVTDQPVAPRSRTKPTEPQTERLITVDSEPKIDKKAERSPRPARGRLAMPADVNAVRREVETELAERPVPELTEDDVVFGIEQARKIAAGDYSSEHPDTQTIDSSTT